MSYKTDFINFLIQKNALKFGEYKLKSGRMSPWFVNTGGFDNGESLGALGNAYAAAILESELDFDTIYGPAYKGIPLSCTAAISLAAKGKNTGYCFNRKEAKTHGEATKAERKKEMIIGRLENGDRIVIIDDVMTTGQTKNEAHELINSVVDRPEYTGLIIAVDRCELDLDAENAIKYFSHATNMPVISIINASDVIEYLAERNDSRSDEIKKYLKAWGTKEIRDRYGLIHETLIDGRTVIPACDVDFERFESLIKVTADIDKIGGYKIPAHSGRKGWEKWVEIARKHTDKPLIYDHQKAGGDIPDTGREFMRHVKEAGFDAIIIFPHGGPRTQVAWTGEALQQGLTVLVGGDMTHKRYLRSEGGYMSDEALDEMYLRGAKQGVRHFVIPGNKIEKIPHYIELLNDTDPIFFSPGFVAQGGVVSEAGKCAGDKWHAISGRAIKDAPDPREAALTLTRQL